MSRRERGNPPWVSRALAMHCASLRRAARRSHLPEPEYTEKDACIPATELGCGETGCALRTEDPGIVLKLTGSGAEARLAAAALELQRRGVTLSGMVRYHGIFAINGGETFLIWREEVRYMGHWWNGLAKAIFGKELPPDARDARGSMRQFWDEGVTPTRKALATLNGYSYGVDHIVSGTHRDVLTRDMTEDDYWRWMADVWRVVVGRDAESKRARAALESYATGDDLWRDTRDVGLRLAFNLLRARSAATQLARTLAPEIATTWLRCFYEGLVLYDLHDGNIGLRAEAGRPSVIMADAMSAILDRALRTPKIEVLGA